MKSNETIPNNYTLLLLTEPSMTTTALIACLKNALTGQVILVEKDQLEATLSCHAGLVLIDLKVFDSQEINPLKKRLSFFNKKHIFALFNAQEISAKELASWPFVKGVLKKVQLLVKHETPTTSS